jgi:hypothetical protein
MSGLRVPGDLTPDAARRRYVPAGLPASLPAYIIAYLIACLPRLPACWLACPPSCGLLMAAVMLGWLLLQGGSEARV